MTGEGEFCGLQGGLGRYDYNGKEEGREVEGKINIAGDGKGEIWGKEEKRRGVERQKRDKGLGS